MGFTEKLLKSNTDEWYTTRDSVLMIVPYLKDRGYKKILCPFDKEESAFVIVLEEYGFDVTYSHLETGTDFFEIDNLSDFDAIVSNPPFSKRQKIFEKLFAARVPFAMIMNFNGLFDNRDRWKMFRDNEFELLIPCGRMRFFNKDCPGKNPNFQSVYVCRGMAKRQIEFVKKEI